MGNLLQQLDLFGMPVEPAPTPKPKKQVPKLIVEAPEEKQIIVNEPVVYASNQIVVKVKSEKPKLEPTETVTIQKASEAIIPKQNKPAEKIKLIGKRGRKSFKEMDAAADLIEIPDDHILNQKLYYSISEVASWFKVNTSLLRYWENEFDILQPRKTRKGDRLFRVEDIKNLQLIYLLLRQRKFSIEGAKNYLKSNKNKIDTENQLVGSLSKFKQFLLELKSSLSN
ncbi:MerR family transcriptional regulator [Sediminibacterium sp.]|uniref:MerR family transcriptional regulator n=1 Tax=Sediminibacterium sp. TaxID=1917865 RepID=UPI003F6E5CE1